jgi:hypothetical protein
MHINTANGDATNILIFHILRTLQENVVGTVLTDSNGRKMIFSAIDDNDNGLNGTDGISYSVMGDGKF